MRVTRASPGTATRPVGDGGAESAATANAGRAIVSADVADGATRVGGSRGMLPVAGAVVASMARDSSDSAASGMRRVAEDRRREAVVLRERPSERVLLNTEPKPRGDMVQVPGAGGKDVQRRGPRRQPWGAAGGAERTLPGGVLVNGPRMSNRLAAAVGECVAEFAHLEVCATRRHGQPRTPDMTRPRRVRVTAAGDNQFPSPISPAHVAYSLGHLPLNTHPPGPRGRLHLLAAPTSDQSGPFSPALISSSISTRATG